MTNKDGKLIRTFESMLLDKKEKKHNPEGKRKRLLREYLMLQALENFLPKSLSEAATNELQTSEYSDEFCKLDFVPTLDRPDIIQQKGDNFPLYTNTTNKTLQCEKLMNDFVEKRMELYNFREPFRRRCNFTTPVEDRLRE